MRTKPVREEKPVAVDFQCATCSCTPSYRCGECGPWITNCNMSAREQVIFQKGVELGVDVINDLIVEYSTRITEIANKHEDEYDENGECLGSKYEKWELTRIDNLEDYIMLLNAVVRNIKKKALGLK